MDKGTRRTLAELITLYELEPEISEVITEGRTDAAVLLWFLRRGGSDAAVYCISDRLDVPTAEVKRRGQNVGHKGRVIASGLKIHEESPEAAARITFVYDIDDDVISERFVPEAPCLLHTDYTSTEMYCFTERPIDKFLKVTLRAPEGIRGEAVLHAIRDSLVDISFIRLILSRAARPVGMITAIEKRCHLTGDVLVARTTDLIKDSICDAGGARALGVSIDSLIADQKQARNNCSVDARLAIRGHDFARICCYYLKTRYPSLFKDNRGPFKTPSVFEVALIACLEFDELTTEKLFQELMLRHGPGRGGEGGDADAMPGPGMT